MIRAYFKPFIKRFFGLFISMAFVSTLAIALLVAFASSITNLMRDYEEYKNNYGAANAVISTNITNKEDFTDLSKTEGLDKYDLRISFDTYLKKEDGRYITTKISSFNEEKDVVFHRYVYESLPLITDSSFINISVTKNFAENNNFKIGSTIKLGFLNFFVEAYVNEIITTAEAINVRANNYIFSDNSDFGYIYISEQELNRFFGYIANQIKDSIFSELEIDSIVEFLKETFDIEVPDLDFTDANFASKLTNQILARAQDGVSEDQLLINLLAKLKEMNIEVSSSTVGSDQFYEIYMQNAMKQLGVASVFLPVFFYVVTMVVIILFLNQIIKAMTSEIGTMMSIGISPKEISKLFAIFTLIMTILAGILGTIVGQILTQYMTGIFIDVYAIPTVGRNLNFLWAGLGVLFLIFVGQLASFISCKAIFKITPKDAMLSNETKRRPLPKWLSKRLEKAPMNIKLGVNSIAQNPRRFFVSTFSIFASFVMILLILFFNASKDELISQTMDLRLQFDCQIYANEAKEESFTTDLKNQTFVTKAEEGLFTFVELKNGDKAIMAETVGLNKDSNMVYIPSEDGNSRLMIPENGIILSKPNANRLDAKKGDIILVNGKELIVVDISTQYFHLTEYVSTEQMKNLDAKYVSTYFVDVTDQNAFLTYLAESGSQSLAVFTESLRKDISNIFRSINIFIVILIGFSFSMGFVILTIMSQNALMEQKRQISIMRAIGFRIIDVSNLWAVQSISQLALSTILAIPSGILLALLLFTLASSSNQVYPFVFSWQGIFIAFGFIVLVILMAHTISMLTIKKWNLADNTRSRE